jgi:hypothetical protein
METTTTTTVRIPSFARGSVKAWRLVADSDGQRGRKGRTKQYVVRITLDTDGTFVVTKLWGKGEDFLHELASSVIGKYGHMISADIYAREAVNAKLGKYELSDKYEADAVSA